ncbi:MAG: hypothetical protein FGF50_10160 [Candidatus Brockarchaeota archaeon]|nr:hypothetical protein [Candidatus Brockarchaeota archaeon]
MRRTRIVTLSLLLAALTILALAQANPAGLFFPQQSQEPVENTEPNLYTDKESYTVGETVIFSGKDYLPEGDYRLNITKDSETYGTIDFEASEEGEIPVGVEWPIPVGVSSGTYTATVYNMTDPENPDTYKQEVASVEFYVNAPTLQTDKDEYIVEETVVFTGAGYTPGGTSYVIKIMFGEQVLAELSFTSSGDGSIPVGVDEVNWTIPFDAPDGTYVAKAYNDTEPEKGVLLALAEFRVNASMAARAEAIFRELDALNATINADVVGINVSLTQKVNVVTKKIEQFMKWVEEDKNNTAANMLNAAVNNLRALIHHVEAQKGKHIDDETADQLIAQAQELIEKMETTISSMDAKGKGKQVSTQARTQEQEMEREGRGQGNSDGKGKAKGKNK